MPNIQTAARHHGTSLKRRCGRGGGAVVSRSYLVACINIRHHSPASCPHTTALLKAANYHQWGGLTWLPRGWVGTISL